MYFFFSKINEISFFEINVNIFQNNRQISNFYHGCLLNILKKQLTFDLSNIKVIYTIINLTVLSILFRWILYIPNLTL
jgi:hypothetical protein